MKDRVSTHPGRITLTPISGNTYDMTMADDPTEQGTPLSKANLLTDETAANIWTDAESRPSNPTVNLALSEMMNKISSGAKIVSGSYVGTGTYGSSSKNSLSFDFEPKLIYLQRGKPFGNDTGICDDAIGKYGGSSVIWVNGVTNKSYGFSNSSSYYINNITWSGNTVTWYSSSNADAQANNSYYTYYYVAIG